MGTHLTKTGKSLKKIEKRVSRWHHHRLKITVYYNVNIDLLPGLGARKPGIDSLAFRTVIWSQGKNSSSPKRISEANNKLLAILAAVLGIEDTLSEKKWTDYDYVYIVLYRIKSFLFVYEAYYYFWYFWIDIHTWCINMDIKEGWWK